MAYRYYQGLSAFIIQRFFTDQLTTYFTFIPSSGVCWSKFPPIDSSDEETDTLSRLFDVIFFARELFLAGFFFLDLEPIVH